MKPCLSRAGAALALLFLACSDPAAPPQPPAPQFEVTEDVTPPVLLHASLTPDEIDASAGPVSLTFRFELTDDLAGIQWCQTLMLSPTQSQHLSVFGSIAGAPRSAVIEVTTSLPQYAESGEWTAAWLVCTDAAGNQLTHNRNVAPFDFPSFTVVSIGDLAPPELVGLQITPDVVDVSGGPVTLTFAFDVTDDLSGMAWCQVLMLSPSEGQHLSVAVTAGQPASVPLEAVTQLPQHAESGEWHMGWIVCADRASNQVTLTQHEPLAFEPPTFTVASAADVTPPTLHSASVSPSVVDASGGPVQMTFRFDLSDDLAGAHWCQMLMSSPSQGQHLNLLVSTTDAPLTAVLEGTTMLPQFAEAGQWSMSWVVCTDAANNQTTYQSNSPLPFPAPSFTVAETDPAALLDQLIARVESLREGGALSNGEANGLLAKLHAARRHVERDHVTPAANELRAFMNAVAALHRSGRMGDADAADLRTRAERILARL